MSQFVDRVEIQVEGGKGGNGCIAFRREKYVPKGGPDGGNGGAGGSVVFTVDPNLKTLLDFRHRPSYRARAGGAGRGKNCSGRGGDELLIRVPPGTVFHAAADGRVLADLTEPGARWIAAAGGRGGKGNTHFATSTRQAPRFAQDGEEGENRDLILELKLIADIGIVGLPNAGKSTLLARVTRANPKIGSYPFTTLKPNLGLTILDDERQMILADVPGLVEGAHRGKGLGLEFLRHVERTRVLLYLIDSAGEHPPADLEILRQELGSHSPSLLKKPSVVVLSRIDLVGPEERPTVTRAMAEGGTAAMIVSSVTGEGVNDLMQRCWQLLEADRGG